MLSMNMERFKKPLFNLHKHLYSLESLVARCRCGMTEQKTNYKKLSQEKKFTHTVLLPKTSFPTRVNLAKRVETDDYIYKKCKFAQLYKWQKENMSGPEFILHDGPPYANGKLHMGHAVNKILKDITIRQKLLQGYKINYVPGWDCHGLPIELKAITENPKFRMHDVIEIRHKARRFASEAIQDQMKVFKSWGIMADWNECYFTFSKEYLKNQFQQFLALYNKGFIYRDMKPIFWSPSSRTALAEAELVYDHHHVSKAVLLGLDVVELPNLLPSVEAGLYKVQALVWTTTPWSLPANQAICFHPNMSYCFVTYHDTKDQVYLLATDCVETTKVKLGKELHILKTFPGEMLMNAQYSHPIDGNKHSPFLPGSHVTSDLGTGLVHTAPAHGVDDFLISLQHQLPLVNMVDDAGCFTADAGSDLSGLPVLKEGNKKILEKLNTLVLHVENYEHSYPCDWRTKEPVIIKASHQWFIDTDAIKTKALDLLHDITVYPRKSQMHSTLVSQLQKRPYWCISRQRVWGVPIPVLFNRNDEKPIISRALVEHYNTLLDKHGPDFWWTLPKDAIVPDHLLKPYDLSSIDVDRGKDILDIWFDSGISWSHTMGIEKQADLYLEGADQFTGWFQSSLMTSVALQGKAPYKSLFVHGFAVDEKGHKMSKSIGNVVDPQEITCGGKDMKKQPAFGVDTLRWWVACHGSQDTNVRVSPSIMEASAGEVHKIRLVSRFLLGALSDYSCPDDSLSFEKFFSLDLWMLDKLKKFEIEVFAFYNLYQYNHVCKTITNFVTNEVSSIYCHMIKDRLYCRKKEDVHRHSCQFVLKQILEAVSRAAAPVLPFLMEEVYLHHPCKDVEHLFYSKTKKTLENWHFPGAVCRVDTALKAKEIMNKISSTKTMELHALVEASGNEFLHLKKLAECDELNELMQVSSSEVVESISELQVKVELTHGKQCGRCRLYTSQFEDKLCCRCEEVLKEMKEVSKL